MNLKLGRRSFLSSLGAAGAGLLSSWKLNAAGFHGSKAAKGAPKCDGDPIIAIKSGLGSTGNIYAELGVTPVINTNGIVTVIGGSLMKPEVMELMRMGNEHFVFLDELEVAAGKFIAKLCKSPEGYTGLVTNGAAASLLVGYAAMMTEDYEPRLEAIPDLTHFPKTEVIIQQSHRNAFDHQIRQTGAKLVVVETREQMINAINPKTVAIHFTNIQSGKGQVSGPETVAIGKAHNVYTFCDASADVPPVSRLWEYPAVGFDMVTFSGGKDICGPAGTGILIGKQDLISWSLLNMSPQEDRIGRPCKVGKEQIFALLKALEIFVNQDEDATLAMYDARAKVITDAIAKFGVTPMPRRYDRQSLGNSTPHYGWEWDPAKVNLTRAQVTDALIATRPVAIGYKYPANYDSPNGSHGMRGRPDPNWPPLDPGRYGTPASAGRDRVPENPNSFNITAWQIKEGEDKIIADRLVEIFSAATAGSSKAAS
jgi:L-seryl-tRNA(Ser) seleniumtransferase